MALVGMSALGRSEDPLGGSEMPSSRLAVVVIGRNEGERLERCLRSVQEMTMPDADVDIVYVDSGSSDSSVAVAWRRGVRVIALTDGPMSAARGRNAGSRAVSAPFVFFVDGDCVVEPAFAVRARALIADPKVAAVWGALREFNPAGTWFNRVIDIHWRDRDHDPPAGPGDYNNGNGLMKRTALEGVGGFDEDEVWGENSELAWRLNDRGYLILHLKEPMLRHDTAMTTLGQYWRRWSRRLGGLGLAVAAGLLDGARQRTPRAVAWSARGKGPLAVPSALA